jgi:RNase P subunit RPR2
MDVHSKFARYVSASDRQRFVPTLARRRAARSASSNLHPAIPRVLCPSCGEMMRLSRIDPWPNNSRKGETTTFECSCGDDYRQTIHERV